jgi:hypothetical protein
MINFDIYKINMHGIDNHMPTVKSLTPIKVIIEAKDKRLACLRTSCFQHSFQKELDVLLSTFFSKANPFSKGKKCTMKYHEEFHV